MQLHEFVIKASGRRNVVRFIVAESPEKAKLEIRANKKDYESVSYKRSHNLSDSTTFDIPTWMDY